MERVNSGWGQPKMRFGKREKRDFGDKNGRLWWCDGIILG